MLSVTVNVARIVYFQSYDKAHAYFSLRFLRFLSLSLSFSSQCECVLVTKYNMHMFRVVFYVCGCGLLFSAH